ncbi:MAG: TIGR04222 domain-containing membrane protein [Planctomycetota bacterium]|nr:MAG: TIGR04222 domain-containing membrane protein [Planctomycetota bacterium]
MHPQHRAIWERIERFDLDPPTRTLRFSARLAQENGWSLAFARRVIREYKRFLFLTVAADHVVCPSDAVDQAWHLHLTYTRSYWDSLCKDILGTPLHHEATRGGQLEQQRHRELYQQTLQSYEEFFGTPPDDIWPPVDQRFGDSLRWQRVNLSRYWLIPRPTRFFPRLLGGAVRGQSWRKTIGRSATALLPIIAIANPFDFTGPQFLAFFAGLYLIALIGGLILRRLLLFGRPVPTNISLNPYEVACLNHGPRMAAAAAIARLLADGMLTPKDSEQGEDGRAGQENERLVVAQPLPESATPIERAVYQRAAEAGREGITIAELQTAVLPEAADIESHLQELGLLNRGNDILARWVPAALMFTLFLIGVGKTTVGIERNRPVGFLVMGCVVVLITAMLFLRKGRLTRAGAKVLHRYKSLAGTLTRAVRKDEATGEQMAMAMAVVGGTALTGTALAALWPGGLFGGKGRGRTYGCENGCGGSGCGGSGCGGGGCGGGCGGCGD